MDLIFINSAKYNTDRKSLVVGMTKRLKAFFQVCACVSKSEQEPQMFRNHFRLTHLSFAGRVPGGSAGLEEGESSARLPQTEGEEPQRHPQEGGQGAEQREGGEAEAAGGGQ